MQIEKKNMRKYVLICILIIMTLFLCGCTENDENKKLDGNLAEINGKVITSDDVMGYMTLFAFSQGTTVEKVTDDSTMEYVMEMVLENMIRQEVQQNYLQSSGINLMEGKAEEYESFKAKILEDAEMKKKYSEGQITDSGIEFIFKSQFCKTKFEELVKTQSAYSDEELRKYYNDNIEEMQRTVVDAAHIMVTSLDLANDIYNQIVSEGADFAELAKKYSEDSGTKDNGGEIGEFGKNETLPAFEEAAFSMEVGDISKPVLTDLGYHIIKINKKSKKQLDFETCKKYIEDVLALEKCNEIIDGEINRTVKYLKK